MTTSVRKVATAALVLVGVAALLAGGALTALRTRWGGDLARRLALARVNALIAGDLQVGRFVFEGDRLSLQGVRLCDPEGEAIVDVREIDVAFSPLALFSKHVLIQRLVVMSPVLSLQQEAAGLNITRALAVRTPPAVKVTPTPPSRSPSNGWVLEVDGLRLDDGAVAYRATGSGFARGRLELSAITLAGSARYESGRAAFAATLDTQAVARSPVRDAVTLKVSGHGQGPERELEIRATVGASTLAVTLRTEGAGGFDLHLARLHVTPALARAVVPVVRLSVPVDVTGHARRSGETITFGADVQTTAGTLAAHGAFDAPPARLRPTVVRAEHVDLGRLVEGWPRSNLSVAVTAECAGADAGALSGTLDVDLPAGRLAAATVGPMTAHVRAVRGQYDVEDLRLALPGLTVLAHGHAGSARLALDVAIDALDLGLTSSTLASFAGLSLPRVAGRGRAVVVLSGTTAEPGLSLSAAFPRLAVDQDQVKGLRITARLPRARVPQVGVAKLELTEARVGGHAFQDTVARVRSDTRRLDADLRVGGEARLSLVAGGRWGPGRRAFVLDRLVLRYPEAASPWALVGRTRLSWRPDSLAIAGFDLRAGAEQVSGELRKRGDRWHAKLDVARLALGRLPRLAVPPHLELAGWLDAHATFDGTRAEPRVDARISVRGARLGRYQHLELDLAGNVQGGRAAGRLNATGLETGVDVRFDVPTGWPLRNLGAPLALDVVIPETDLRAVLAAVEPEDARASRIPQELRDITGSAGLSLHVHGTGAAPVLELDVSARELVLSGRTIGTGTLRVTGGDAPLTVALTLPSAAELTAAPGAAARPGATQALGSGSLRLRSPFPLASLLRGWPSRDALERTPFAVTGELRGVSLAALARWAQSTTVAGGTAALRVSASGTALAPAGALNLQVEGATGPRFPPTDARLDAAFGAHDTRVAVRVLRGGRELAFASGILRLAARRLRDLGAVAAAPLDLRAAVGPLRLSRADIPGDPGRDTTSEPLSMTVRSVLSIAGSLADPQATATVDLANARYGLKPIGEARLLLGYATGRAQADVRIHAASNGQLRLTGWGALDLGYPWRARWMDFGAAPFEAKLDAQRFELTMLSGISPQVRGVGGELSGTCTVGGTMRTPLVRGQVEWVKGALTLTGLGSYSNIHLKAHGDPSAIWLDELSLASGEGSGRLTASAVENGAGDYNVKSNLSLRRFPVYAQGQALAVVAADGSIDGHFVSRGAGNGTATTSPSTLRASVRLSEAHVELTDAKRKDLQPLERPADVVLVDERRPLGHGEVAARPRGPTPKALGPAPSPVRVHLEVEAPRNLWVRGKDASLELGLAPGFHVELGASAARIYGQVVVRRGRIDVLGRRFDLQAGSLVQFTGRPDTPRVDVSAKHFNETEKITVLLKAKGTLDKMAISVSSPDRPDLTEGQIYALIITGKLQFGGNTAGSTSASDEAASLVGGIVADRLQETLAKRLPLDVLTLQAGEGLTGSRLEAGTYLTRKLYAGYVGRVGANPALLQNRNAVHVEYQLGRRWSFDGEYGDVGTGTADIVWTKDY